MIILLTTTIASAGADVSLAATQRAIIFDIAGISSLAAGVVCYLRAVRLERNRLVWTIVGLWYGVVGLGVFWIVSRNDDRPIGGEPTSHDALIVTPDEQAAAIERLKRR